MWEKHEKLFILALWYRGEGHRQVCDQFADNHDKALTKNQLIGIVHRSNLGARAELTDTDRQQILDGLKSDPAALASKLDREHDFKVQPLAKAAHSNMRKKRQPRLRVSSRAREEFKAFMMSNNAGQDNGISESGKITTCQHIEGDPFFDSDWFYCGQPVAEGSSWCPFHRSIYVVEEELDIELEEGIL